MARSVNKVILLGHLARDPELSYLPSGQSVCKFSIATNHSYKDKDGEWKESTEFHSIVAWAKLGENAAQFLTKGSQAYVEGRLQTRKWKDKNDQERTTTEIVADEVVFIGGKKEGTTAKPSGTQRRQQPEIDDSSEIPF